MGGFGVLCVCRGRCCSCCVFVSVWERAVVGYKNSHKKNASFYKFSETRLKLGKKVVLSERTK